MWEDRREERRDGTAKLLAPDRIPLHLRRHARLVASSGRIPRDEEDNTHEAAAARRDFVKEQTGVELEHVSSYSDGTGLATQRECLELLGRYGEGKVRKLAEIVAATVLCGELSLVRRSWPRSGSRHTTSTGATGSSAGPRGRTGRQRPRQPTGQIRRTSGRRSDRGRCCP